MTKSLNGCFSCNQLSDVNNNTFPSDFDPDLYKEYIELLTKLKSQGSRKDVALLMRLTIVMFDLGLYVPSPP